MSFYKIKWWSINNFLYMYIFNYATKTIPTYVNSYFLLLPWIQKPITPENLIFFDFLKVSYQK